MFLYDLYSALQKKMCMQDQLKFYQEREREERDIIGCAYKYTKLWLF